MNGKLDSLAFVSAIKAAGANGFIQEQALACELFGRCSSHDPKSSQIRITDAIHTYEQWGAYSKVLLTYPFLLNHSF